MRGFCPAIFLEVMMLKSSRPFAVPVTLLLLLALVPGPASSQAGESPRWIRLETAHFTFFTDGPKDVALSTAYDLEQLRYVLTQLWPDSRFEAPVPTLLYVFGDEAAFHPYRLGGGFSSSAWEGPRHVGEGVQTAGYLVPHEHGNYAALVVSPETRPVGFVYKQYIHHLLHQKLPALPLWLRHGLAEYYSTFEVTGEQASIGLPIRSHLQWLAQHLRYEEEHFSLAGILATSKLPGDSEAAAKFFRQSWVMVHFLSSEPERRQQLGAFARQAASGVPVGRAFDESFDFDVAELEKRLAAYLQRDRFNYLQVAIDRGAHPSATLTTSSPRPRSGEWRRWRTRTGYCRGDSTWRSTCCSPTPGSTTGRRPTRSWHGCTSWEPTRRRSSARGRCS